MISFTLLISSGGSRSLIRGGAGGGRGIENGSELNKKFFPSPSLIFISLIRMRSKRDIKMGRLCTPGGAVLGIVGGGV